MKKPLSCNLWALMITSELKTLQLYLNKIKNGKGTLKPMGVSIFWTYSTNNFLTENFKWTQNNPDFKINRMKVMIGPLF